MLSLSLSSKCLAIQRDEKCETSLFLHFLHFVRPIRIAVRIAEPMQCVHDKSASTREGKGAFLWCKDQSGFPGIWWVGNHILRGMMHTQTRVVVKIPRQTFLGPHQHAIARIWACDSFLNRPATNQHFHANWLELSEWVVLINQHSKDYGCSTTIHANE